MKEMTKEEARKIMEEAPKAFRIDPSDGLMMMTGEGPSLQEIARATEVLGLDKEPKKEMSLEKAKKIVDKAFDNDKDGLAMATGKGPSWPEIEQATQIVFKAKEEEYKKLMSGELRPFETLLYAPDEAYRALRLRAEQEREKPFLKRLFDKKEKPFYWEDPMEWLDVEFNSKGHVLFSHRIDLEYLTPSQEKQVRNGLKKHGINFEERQATSSRGIVQKGDRTLRIRDKESVEKLRYNVFHWAMQGRPTSMPLREYTILQENIKSKKSPLIPQKTLALPPEPERPFDWRDSMCWQDVKFESKGEILFSHRLRLEGLTPEQEKEVKEELAKRHINFTERQASFDEGKIKKGDRTLRISDKESIETLRYMVFNWAQGKGTKPVSMSLEKYEEYRAHRAAIAQNKSGRS